MRKLSLHITSKANVKKRTNILVACFQYRVEYRRLWRSLLVVLRFTGRRVTSRSAIKLYQPRAHKFAVNPTTHLRSRCVKGFIYACIFLNWFVWVYRYIILQNYTKCFNMKNKIFLWFFNLTYGNILRGYFIYFSSLNSIA